MMAGCIESTIWLNLVPLSCSVSIKAHCMHGCLRAIIGGMQLPPLHCYPIHNRRSYRSSGSQHQTGMSCCILHSDGLSGPHAMRSKLVGRIRVPQVCEGCCRGFLHQASGTDVLGSSMGEQTAIKVSSSLRRLNGVVHLHIPLLLKMTNDAAAKYRQGNTMLTRQLWSSHCGVGPRIPAISLPWDWSGPSFQALQSRRSP